MSNISLYTFLIKQISNKREKKCKLTVNLLTNYGIQNYFQFKLPNHGKGTCEDIDTISMQWNQKTQGTTWRKRVLSKISYFFFLIFFNHIIILNLNDKIMEKEPVRVLTLDSSMWWNQNNTENHIEKEDTTYLFSSFFFFLFLFKVIIF